MSISPRPSKMTDFSKISLHPKSPCLKVTFDDFERPAEVEDGKALILREEEDFSALIETPTSDGEEDSTSTRSTPSLQDGDTELYFMELTSPGLETPRVSLLQPQDATVRCIAKSDNSSTDSLVSGVLVSMTTNEQTCTKPMEKRQGMHLDDEDKEVGNRWWLKLDGSVGKGPHRLSNGVLAV